MSESYEQFSDPRRVIEDGLAAKAERKRALHEALAGPREPDPADAEAVLDELVDAVAERIVQRVQAVEPEAEQQQAGAAGQGFDGGARRDRRRRVETHDQTLLALLRTRAADRGVNF